VGLAGSDAAIVAKCQAAAERHGLNGRLVAAIAWVESRHDPDAVRYEPGYAYLKDPADHASKHRITRDTETVLQRCSWGVLQIMGATARDQGFDRPLVHLLKPDVGIEFGCRFLRRMYVTWHPDKQKIAMRPDILRDVSAPVIAAYNAGSPRYDAAGVLVNVRYVERVRRAYAALGG